MVMDASLLLEAQWKVREKRLVLGFTWVGEQAGAGAGSSR